MSDQLLSQAAEYIRAGKNSEARQILMQVLKENPYNEPAWLWLVQTIPSDAMRISALEQCLKYFPESQKARRGLERLKARQAAPETPPDSAGPPLTGPLPSLENPPRQAPADLPPVPRFMPQETSAVEPPASSQDLPTDLVPPAHPFLSEEPQERGSPSILAGLFSSEPPQTPAAAQADQDQKLAEDIPDLSQSGLSGRFEQPPPAAEIPAEEIQELRAAGARGRSRLTRRSALRVVLIVFYAVVLVGGGYVVWQRYGSDIIGWVKGLPQTVTGAVSPASTPTRPVTQTSGTGPVVPEDNGSTPRSGLGEVLYISERDGLSDLYVNHLNGSGPALVVPAGSPSSQILDPAWSVDGNQIAFIRGEGQKTDLFTAGADGSGLYVRTNDHAGNAHPSWAPDGNRLVFVSQRDGGQDLYLLNFSNAGVTRLTDKAGKNSSPAWSPDGSRIAFVSDREGFLGLYLINPDGSGLLRLSSPAQSVSSPAWSPDSQWIAFASVSKTDRLLYVVSKDGKSEKRITFSPGLDDHPAWSPDGAWIVFSSERRKAGQPTLFMVRANGKDMYLFDTEVHLDTSPVWSLVIKK